MSKRILATLLALSLLASDAFATWSIVVVNRRTGEVAIGAATCLPNTHLIGLIPAIAVGRGGGCIQAAGNSPALVLLYDELVAGADPAGVLQALIDADPSPDQRQIGVAGFAGEAVTYTGRKAGRARGGVVGEVGDLSYAIQGNVLTGSAVWLNARDALLATPGDLSQKLLAAMQAARDAGGDGRCSCSLGDPTGCGSPPPSFEKSAHCGFMVVARIGDPDAPCLRGNDCANAAYYMSLNIGGTNAQQNDPDPVDQLELAYAKWRANRAGEADAILSTVETVTAMPADGRTRRTVTVRLVDVDGVPLTTGGDDVRVGYAPTSSGSRGPRAPLATFSSVTDHGDGTYTFELHAARIPGTETLVVTARAGNRRVTLYPYLDVRLDPPGLLHAGFESVPASEHASVPFVVDEQSRAGAVYAIVAGLSGTSPGTRFGNMLLPLNRPLFASAPGFGQRVASRNLVGGFGRLDATGRAEASFEADPAVLAVLAGRTIHWASLVAGQGPPLVSAPVALDVLP